MIISRIALKNWRNFRSADVELRDRVFLVGPNASGKSNFLDALRFLRDVARDGGGLQKAIADRDGLPKIRCLAARRNPDVELDVTLAPGPGEPPAWRYAISVRQEVRGNRLPYLIYERVWREGKLILDRPDEEDERDRPRLTETHLQQISKNADFREIARLLESIQYLHLVPQLVRYPSALPGPGLPQDPFGTNFLERVARTPANVRRSRLRKIETALRVAVPQLKDLELVKDQVTGAPHLEAVYEHWRPKGARQREDQFSDGTLRLIGLLWALLDGEAPLLLEEPELSLNAAIVRVLPSLLHRVLRPKKRQVLLSTHSFDLLSDRGIGGEEVLVLTPTAEGTKIELAASRQEIRSLLEAGLSAADAVLAPIAPPEVVQLRLFSSG